MATRTASTTVLRLAGWSAMAGGVLAAAGVVFLAAMFTAFGVGERSPGLVFGWTNDVLVMLSYVLAAPGAVALWVLLRPRAPVLSGLLFVLGIAAIAAIGFLQLLLVVGALTFEEQIGPASIAFLALAAWFLLTGYLGRRSGVLPGGVRMGLLAATYVGYPVWAVWLGRRLLRMAGGPDRHHPIVIAEESQRV